MGILIRSSLEESRYDDRFLVGLERLDKSPVETRLGWIRIDATTVMVIRR